MYSDLVKSRFLRALEQLKYGTVHLETPEGESHVFKGSHPGPDAHFEMADWGVLSSLAAKGSVGMTEVYRDERFKTNDLIALLELALMNNQVLSQYIDGGFFPRMIAKMAYLFDRNSLRGSRRNIQAHYDLGNDFYRLWLDDSMTYSSALFQPGDSLEVAQSRKYDRILDCLGQQSGNLLEIGCGWGGFAERALTRGDFSIKGITLSDEQAAFCQNRLNDRADIRIEDYRKQTGQYQNIVSIEMFEAVGQRYWPTYFSQVKELLHKNGKAVLQTIAMKDDLWEKYRRSQDMIRTFIFPGGLLPSPAMFQQEAKKAGLQCGEAFYFGQDYGKTLEVWKSKFESRLTEIKALGFDDKFIRVWRFYLAACIAEFRQGRTEVMQVELTHA